MTAELHSLSEVNRIKAWCDDTAWSLSAHTRNAIQSQTSPKITCLQIHASWKRPLGWLRFSSHVRAVSAARWENQPGAANTLFIFTPATLSVQRWWLTLCCWVWTWVSLKITQGGHVSRQPHDRKIKGEVGGKQEVLPQRERTWKMQLLPETVKKKICGIHQRERASDPLW